MENEEELKKDLERQQFIRYVLYKDVMEFVRKEFHFKKLKNPKIIEFGGSNGFIQKIFNHPNYEVADNYPEVDVQDLHQYADNSYDFVILDQILEHVPKPRQALKEVHRILKKGGWLINSTPFLIQIHPCPSDYWRFSKEGMKELLSDFSDVNIKAWGNRETVIHHLEVECWPSTKEMREQGLFNIENEEKFPYTIWAYARK